MSTRRVIAGAMHYFRTLPQQWPERLTMLRAMGLDTVETYVPWNLHEPRPGEYDFAGLADLEGFLPYRGRRRRAQRDRAPWPVHLRRVGERRVARLAAGGGGDPAALRRPALSRRS